MGEKAVKRGVLDWILLIMCLGILLGYICFLWGNISSSFLNAALISHAAIASIFLICALLSNDTWNFQFFLLVSLTAVLTPITYPLSFFVFSKMSNQKQPNSDLKMKPKRRSPSRVNFSRGKKGSFKVGDTIINGIVKRVNQKTITIDLPNGDTWKVPRESVFLEKSAKVSDKGNQSIKKKGSLRLVSDQEIG